MTPPFESRSRDPSRVAVEAVVADAAPAPLPTDTSAGSRLDLDERIAGGATPLVAHDGPGERPGAPRSRTPWTARFGPIRWYAVLGAIAMVSIAWTDAARSQPVSASAVALVATVTPPGPPPSAPVVTVTPYGGPPAAPVATVTPPGPAPILAMTVTPAPGGGPETPVPPPSSTAGATATTTATTTASATSGATGTAGPGLTPTAVATVGPTVGRIYLPLTLKAAEIGWP